MATSRKSTLYFGPVNLDLDSNSASVDLPGGGQVSVSPAGAEVTLPGRGRVNFGPGGGSVDVEGAGRVEVRSDGVVLFPDGTVWNSRGSTFPDVIPTPTPGGPVPIPYPNLGSLPIPNFETTPIKIPIPVPHFVVEPLEIPVTLPKLVPQMFDLPLALPRVQPTSVDWPWSLPAPPRLPDSPFSLPSMPDLIPTGETPAPYVTEIKSAIAQAFERWLPSVRVTHGVINGPVGVIPPGALSSNVDLQAAMRAGLGEARVPLDPYGSITDAFAKAWLQWLAGFSTMVQYPAFAHWPGAEAPPMPAIGQPLSVGSSSAPFAVSVVSLSSAAMNTTDARSADPGYGEAVRQLSSWYTIRFAAFKMVTILTNVLGRGPVPSYAPPVYPVGPVIGGTIMPSSGVLVGSNPFRVP